MTIDVINYGRMNQWSPHHNAIPTNSSLLLLRVESDTELTSGLSGKGKLYQVELGQGRTYWSERSACAARAVLQTSCVANVVATKFVILFSFLFLSFFLYLITFLPEGVVLGSWKFVCALIRVKLDEKWQKFFLGPPPKKIGFVYQSSRPFRHTTLGQPLLGEK